MPHKVAIIPFLDELTPEGRAIGAINTIFLQKSPSDGTPKLIGTNTDCIGVREALKQNVTPQVFESWKGKAGAIIGGGGTSRAAVYALKKWLGCETVYMLNREESEVAVVQAECTAAGFGDNLIFISSAAHAASLPPPVVIVSAVPDFEPVTESEIAVREEISIFLGAGSTPGTLLEMCYHPSTNTAITRLAKEKGWVVVPGTEAMIFQGVEQDKYWTGREASELPVAKMQAVIHAAVEARAKAGH
jgi:quinate dehydrogenase